MGQGSVLQVCDDLLDDGVTTVVCLGLQDRQRGVGEHCVVPPDAEQLALRVRLDVVGVGVADPPHDQPVALVAGLGDLRDPVGLGVIWTQAASGMAAMAARTVLVWRTVIE